MTTKLNLTIEEELANQIKRYAKKNNRSVSGLVEDHFKAILKSTVSNKIPFSKRAAGIIKGEKFNNAEKLKDKYLKTKHGL
ncbi:MAG: DUF6364 family protein [Ferruginibacter sp.]